MRKTLTPYKLKRIATESLRNSLRLHSDAILLYTNGSHASAFQLSILSLEELAKAKEVAHYYYTSRTNGYLGKEDPELEQQWLLMLYSHPWKQFAFVGRDLYDYSPTLVRFIQSKKMEAKKQAATYVGLARQGKKIDVNSRISTPARITNKDSRQFISLVNSEFLFIFNVIQVHAEYFGVDEADDMISAEDHQFLFAWPHDTGMKPQPVLKRHRHLARLAANN